MTPFGVRMQALRRERGVSQKTMAAALGVSPSYLSALEHGRKGAPNWATVQKIIGFFNIIWDEAEELQRIARSSHPRVLVDTSGLSARATELANLLAETIGKMPESEIESLIESLKQAANAAGVRTAREGRRASR
jgi:transcriptional regulator with XRE-family HTH domain